jgi:23S rRNA (uracil1939-C5)-methyltransferase/tRNA (uracil-5-)-methyltransferase
MSSTTPRPPKNFVPEPFAYHEEIELRIDDLTNLGEGVGRIDGWVVMVPFALPGERVKARIWRNKKNYSDADLVGILEASPDRVEPPCPLFMECGGCQYQHLSYDGQKRWKTNQIHELLKRLGGIETEVQPCWGSPETYGYRSKLTPHYDKPKDGRLRAIGFQRFANRSIVDVPQCPIASPAINEALPQARAELQTRTKKMRKGGTLLLRDSLEGVTSDNRAIIMERVGDRTFQFVAGEFFQNNPHILPELVGYALKEAEGPRFLVDAYCGVGVFGLCGADRFERVAGVEVNPTAIELARVNARINGVSNIDFVAGSAEAIFAGLEFPGAETAVILDPPRKGCDEVFLRQLFAFAPARIVYVSCGPDTQARDLKSILAEGYSLDRVQPFDLFPQTRHIENVVTLSRQ